jgi:hypothetical protein
MAENLDLDQYKADKLLICTIIYTKSRPRFEGIFDSYVHLKSSSPWSNGRLEFLFAAIEIFHNFIT